MAWSRLLQLWLDVDSYGSGRTALLDGASSSALQQQPNFVQGDKVTLRLRFRQRGAQGALSTPVQLDSGFDLYFAGKLKSDLESGSVIFLAQAFTETEDPDNEGEYFYDATLNLNTTELNTAIAGLPITARVDVEIQNTTNSQHLTLQFNATVQPQVYNDDAEPQSALTPGENSNIRWHNGNLALYKPDSASFHLLAIGPDFNLVVDNDPLP